MSFRRTSLGLRNQPTFFNSDIVVYVEGRDLQESVILQDEDGDAVTQDSVFWKGVIESIVPGARLHFKALGSKKELIKLSSGLDETVRGKLIICTDRDLDDFLPSTVRLNFLVSTYRYSWESDIWVWLVFLRVLGGLLPSARIPASRASEARACRDRFYRDSRKLIRLDVQTALHADIECFVPRANPSAVVDTQGVLPKVNKRYFCARAREFRGALGRPWRPGVIAGVSHKRHYYGKAVDRFHCQLMSSILKKIGLPANIPFYVFQNLAIKELPEVLNDPQRAAQLEHYRTSIDAVL